MNKRKWDIFDMIQRRTVRVGCTKRNIPTPHSFQFSFNNILPSLPRSLDWTSSSAFQTKILYAFLSSSYILYVRSMILLSSDFK